MANYYLTPYSHHTCQSHPRLSSSMTIYILTNIERQYKFIGRVPDPGKSVYLSNKIILIKKLLD